MSIKYVVLGYLNWRPMSGYDVKKRIAETEVMPWTASDNEIYEALVELHKDGWVTKTMAEVDSGSNHHIYVISDKGVEALRQWVGSEPEPPQTNKPFLNQLMWADSLDPKEMDQLLEAYLNGVGEKLFFIRVQASEGQNMPNRTLREKYLWGMVYKHWIAQYEMELRWIRQLREEVMEMAAAG